jgi:hypothetical protein
MLILRAGSSRWKLIVQMTPIEHLHRIKPSWFRVGRRLRRGGVISAAAVTFDMPDPRRAAAQRLASAPPNHWAIWLVAWQTQHQ